MQPRVLRLRVLEKYLAGEATTMAKGVEDDITYVIMPSLNLSVADCQGLAEHPPVRGPRVIEYNPFSRR